MPWPCSLSLVLALHVLPMAETMITISGNHDDDVNTRLTALGDVILYDDSVDCWLYDALGLSRYDADATTEGFVPVPAEVMWIALGRGCVAYGNEPRDWYATNSAPSDTFFNNAAIAANAKASRRMRSTAVPTGSSRRRGICARPTRPMG